MILLMTAGCRPLLHVFLPGPPEVTLTGTGNSNRGHAQLGPEHNGFFLR